MLEEMKGTIQRIVEKTAEDREMVIFDNNRLAIELCYSIEKILSHGIKGGSAIFNRKSYWSLFEKILSLLPPRSINPPASGSHEEAVRNNVKMAMEEGKTNIARARLLIRLSLNSHSLSPLLSLLLLHQPLLKFSPLFLFTLFIYLIYYYLIFHHIDHIIIII